MQIDTDEFGNYLGNGSYSVGSATQQMQNGVYDTWMSYSVPELIGFDHFLFTNAFASTHFSALMKRQHNLFNVNFFALRAGIKVPAFCLIFATILLLAMIMFVNEKCQTGVKRNNCWNIASALMPSNTTPLKLQRGWTRKMLIINCGFTVLLSTTYYQCNLLQQLMIPKQPSQITFEQILSSTKAKQSQLHFMDGLLDFIGNMKELEDVLAVNPPATASVNPNIAELFHQHNDAVLIAEHPVLMVYLSNIPPEECSIYAVVDVREFGTYFATLSLHKERKYLLEHLNAIVAERMDFIDRLINKNQLKQECWNQIYPPSVIEPRFN
jgi:hypothetical protein